MDIGTHENIYRYILDRDTESLIRVQKEHVMDFKKKFIHG